VELLRGLQDRFEQVVLITHIEPVREGLDRVISVTYDAELGHSVVSETGEAPIVEQDLPLFESDRAPRERARSEETMGPADAGAAL